VGLRAAVERERVPDDNSDIYICYRRRDAAGHARALHRDLCQRLGGRRIFFDQQSIEAGEVFPDRLRDGIASCRVVLVLIAHDWLESINDRERRLDIQDDFVRQEIADGLRLDKKVIPVLFDDTTMPEATQLPRPLSALSLRDGLTLRGKNLEYNVQLEELVRIIARLGIPERMFRTVKLFRSRNGTPASARTPVLPEATAVVAQSVLIPTALNIDLCPFAGRD
jgi:hypothetical protein